MLNLTKPKVVEDLVRTEMRDSQLRLAHTLVVARRVRESCKLLLSLGRIKDVSPDLAFCAALLHEIGGSPRFSLRQFLPIDTFVALRAHGYPEIASWVGGISYHPEETILAGYSGIEASPHIIGKLITYWDLHVRPGGEEVSFERRVEDLLQKYDESTRTGEALRQALPRLETIILEVDELLKK